MGRSSGGCYDDFGACSFVRSRYGDIECFNCPLPYCVVETSELNRFLREERNQQITTEFYNGKRPKELAAANGLSLSRIYDILER